MKKLFFMTIIGLSTYNVNAQSDPLKELACKGLTDAIEKNIKSTQNPKQSAKSATWVKLADSYLDHASECGTDSMASVKAYDNYKKALDVEIAAGGKKFKEIEAKLDGPNTLYQVFIQQGVAFYNVKNMEKASDLFNYAALVNKKDTTATLYAGIVDQGLGNNDRATKNFNLYLANGGKDPAVFYSLAQIYKIDKKYDEAVAILRKGTVVNPKDKDLQAEIINTYIVSNNIPGAIIDLEKMVESDPNNANTQYNLGSLYENRALEANIEVNKIREQLESANTSDAEKKVQSEKERLKIFEDEIVNLTNKMKREPKNAASIKKTIAEVTSQKVAQEEALKKAEATLQQKMASKAALSGLDSKLSSAESTFKENKEKAYKAYTKVLALDPDNFDVNFNMAVMHFNEAVEIKRELDAMDMATYREKGKAIEEKACLQFQKSKPYFDKCQSLNASDESVNENLKMLVNILEQCK
jgi:tetratricopeptide (TPR) repeat protein